MSEWGGAGAGLNQLSTGINGGIAVYGSYVYVADQNNHRIERFTLDASGTPRPEQTMAWGSLGAARGQFDHPQGVAVDPRADSAGDHAVYVADDRNDRIQKFTSAGDFLGEVGCTGTQPGQFRFAYDVGVDAVGNLYAADNNNHRTQVFDATSLLYLRRWGSLGTSPGQLGYPRSLAAVTGAAGGVYVGDTSNNRVQGFGADGTVGPVFGSSGRGAGRFTQPKSVAVRTIVDDEAPRRTLRFVASAASV